MNGESTAPGSRLDESAPCSPEDAYGQSKWEAEKALQCLARETGLEVTIVRPPLVYGAGVKGNLLSLLALLDTGLPLPFGAIHNRRSMVSVTNLANALVMAARHPDAAGEVFMVSDGDDLSTPELVARLRRLMGRPERLVPVPPSCLRLAARLSGRTGVAERLLGSLVVNPEKIRKLLGWRPPVSVDKGMESMVLRFLKGRGKPVSEEATE